MFAIGSSAYGADGAGDDCAQLCAEPVGPPGADSTLDSNGASIFLYNIGGVITGSTSATPGRRQPGNTIFTIAVNAAPAS